MSKRLARMIYTGTTLAVLATPCVAAAQEGGAEGAAAAAAPLGIGAWGKPMGAALAIGLSALGAGWAQSKIGSAGQATLAERPEERIWVVTLTALPEVIVLLGLVMAFVITSLE